MKVQFTGKKKTMETVYFNREIRPDEIRDIKNAAGKVLIRSRVWKEYHKPKVEDNPKVDTKSKEGSK